LVPECGQNLIGDVLCWDAIGNIWLNLPSDRSSPHPPSDQSVFVFEGRARWFDAGASRHVAGSWLVHAWKGMRHDCFGCGHANTHSFDLDLRLFDLGNIADHSRVGARVVHNSVPVATDSAPHDITNRRRTVAMVQKRVARPECGTRQQPSRLKSMIAAFVWHWWIAPILVGSVVLFIVASVGGYLSQVTKDRYPHREARRD
jgi:hypothetical protein